MVNVGVAVSVGVLVAVDVATFVPMGVPVAAPAQARGCNAICSPGWIEPVAQENCVVKPAPAPICTPIVPAAPFRYALLYTRSIRDPAPPVLSYSRTSKL